MTQVRFHDYNRPLLSFDENRRLLGIIEPGRIRGFDTPIWSTNGIRLSHAATGIVETTLAGDFTNPVGVVLTKQGVVMKETDIVPAEPLPISSNSLNPHKRVDTIVMEHSIVEIAGGTPGTYSIIQGPDGSEVPAELTSPESQVVIGYITMAPSSSTTAGATFTYFKTRHVGGLLAAILNQNNQFSNLNEFKTLNGVREVLNDGTDDWVGIKSLTSNGVININQVGISNTLQFLPRVQGSTFLMVTNNASSSLNVQNTIDDSLGNDPLHPSIWADYAAISTNETTVDIGPGGWVLLWCNIGEEASPDNPYWQVVMTSGTFQTIDSVASVVGGLSTAINSKANKEQEAWKAIGVGANPSFLNSFGNAAGYTLRFKKDEIGNVYLQGAVSYPLSAANGLQVFTLPTGYRPSQTVSWMGTCLGEPVQIQVTTAGAVTLFSSTGLAGVSSAPFAMDGIFRVD